MRPSDADVARVWVSAELRKGHRGTSRRRAAWRGASPNRRWAVQAGAGLKQGDPLYAADWLSEWLADGTLAGAAWCGFMRLPKHGLYRILEAIGWTPPGA